MLARFSPKIGAATFVALALLYMVAALASGHSARAEAPVDLTPTEAGLDVWRALTLMVDHPGDVAVVDVRSADRYELYHLADAQSLPGASAADLRKVVEGKPRVLVVASSDAAAAKLVGSLSSDRDHCHFLEGGVANWYLNVELPIELFSSKPPPHGHASAMRVVRSWLDDRGSVPLEQVKRSISTLAALGFTPDQLAGKKKAVGAKKKKISGGCG